ncbi:hypothetical protein ABZX95_17085 [Streptomyces sp. NPDC004232]|uniref:hypothetical protein n=1 Tax=Streptomyces sp. NPDC004232 TaxID=3154454 RepID=UPI0033A89AA6
MSTVYETPPNRRAVRRAVTREDVEAEQAEAELTEWLLDSIENNPDVRAAILRVVAGAPKPRQPRPTTTQPIRRGRGR